MTQPAQRQRGATKRPGAIRGASILSILTLVTLSGSLAGCKADNPLVRGKSEASSGETAKVTPDPARYDRNDLLDSLRAGKRLHDLGRWTESNLAFENAHRLMPWKEDSVDTPEEVVRLVGTTLTNNTFGAYQGKIFEGALINYYRALNTLMLDGEAQVEFNRLEERQKNSETQMKSFIIRAREQAKGSLASQSNMGVEASLKQSRANFSNGWSDIDNNLRVFEARNPVGDITSAFFRSSSSRVQLRDSSRIQDALKNAEKSIPSRSGRALAKYIATKAQNKTYALEDQVLLIYEDGVGPSLTEFRVDLPLFFVSSKVLYSGMALPKFQKGRAERSHIKVSNGAVTRSTAVITDSNRLIGLEFKANYDGVVAKEIVSTILKTSAQYAINKKIDQETTDKNKNSIAGAFLKGLTAVAQASLTKADLRHWDNLPNTIQAVLVDRPKNGVLSIKDSQNKEISQISVSEPGNYIVLARSSSSEKNRLTVYSKKLR